MSASPRIGLALGSGASRGWSHIGVINALLDAGIEPDVVRASMSLPGLFPPVRDQGRWLVDGGLVNPVPVTACHALGADVVIAVNLNSDIVGKRLKRTKVTSAREEAGLLQHLRQQARDYSNSLFSSGNESEVPPGLLSVISSSINIFQDRITRSRLAGDPADVLISPRLSDVGLLEFGKAAEAIKKGEDCVNRALPEIRSRMNRNI